MAGARLLTAGAGGRREGTGGGYSHPCDGLELETSVWAYIELNTNTDRYTQKYIRMHTYKRFYIHAHTHIHRWLHIEVFIHTHRLVYTYISLLCQLRESQSKDIPVAMSKLRAQILFSNTISKKRNQGYLGEMADYRTGRGNIQNAPKASCSAKSDEVF